MKNIDNKNLTKKKNKFKHWLKEFGTILAIFFVLHSFVVASFVVPTGSMENEIMTGDFLLVNKFVFGGTTPRTIPFTDIRIPHFKLPSFWNIERGDVIVFAFPGMRDEIEPPVFAYYLKRAVALAGDTVEIKNRVLFVNNTPAPLPRNIKFNSGNIKPAGQPDERIFPVNASYNEDNYGPIRVPKKGDIIELNPSEYYKWKIFIEREGHQLYMRNGNILLDGKPVVSYIVEKDYVFGLGDNRDNSLDSRFWGFIPVDEIVGTPLIVYWSWDPDIPLTDIFNKFGSVRFHRIGMLVK